MQRTVERTMAANAMAELPDGLHGGLCGAGAPMPSPNRSSPCVVVMAGLRLVVIDSGTGGSQTLARMGFDAGQIERVLLTHFHSDHIDGLGEMLQRWVAGAHTAPLPVHGPDIVAPSGFGGVAVPFSVAGGDAVIFDEGGLKITAFAVDHAPIEPAVGYRIAYKGRTAVIGGDTKPNASVETHAAGADLRVHDALSP